MHVDFPPLLSTTHLECPSVWRRWPAFGRRSHDFHIAIFLLSIRRRRRRRRRRSSSSSTVISINSLHFCGHRSSLKIAAVLLDHRRVCHRHDGKHHAQQVGVRLHGRQR